MTRARGAGMRLLLGVATLCLAGLPLAARSQQIFESLVVVSPLAEGDQWFLREPLLWRADSGHRVCVPENFVTDFASIPRPLWALLPQWDGYGPAAVMHDYLYWAQLMSRGEADRYMLEAMRDQKVSRLKRWIVFAGVRAGGWFAWRANARHKAAGERRVIPGTHVPVLATITWKQLRRDIWRTDAPELCAAR